MNDCGGTDQTVDEAILIYEVSDHAIENAAGSIQDKGRCLHAFVLLRSRHLPDRGSLKVPALSRAILQ
jgi:hypothetical protein